jgi:5'-phosphate synthase pdxT subunit
VAVPTIGVLALQGDVREHLHALSQVGARAVPIKRSGELEGLDGLILPGGESTTVVKLARTFEVFEAIADRIKTGMPAFAGQQGPVLATSFHPEVSDDLRLHRYFLGIVSG